MAGQEDHLLPDTDGGASHSLEGHWGSEGRARCVLCETFPFSPGKALGGRAYRRSFGWARTQEYLRVTPGGVVVVLSVVPYWRKEERRHF